MDHDLEALRNLRERLADLPPDTLEELMRVGASVPKEWTRWSPAQRLECLRCRLEFTQEELGRKAGVAQPLVSRIEGGADALLSTWVKLYGAMGFELVLLPVSKDSLVELRRRAEEGRPPGAWLRQRARPRRSRIERLGTTPNVPR